MKSSVSTMSLFQIILVFTLLFAAFLSVAVTYNRVYKLKNETISIIEKYEGVNKTSLKIINNYLRNSGYNTKGSCESGEYGVTSLEDTKYEIAASNKKYYYCLSYYCTNGNCKAEENGVSTGNEIFFKTKLFFKFNLPFFGELFTFKITGDTKEIILYETNTQILK